VNKRGCFVTHQIEELTAPVRRAAARMILEVRIEKVIRINMRFVGHFLMMIMPYHAAAAAAADDDDDDDGDNNNYNLLG
jgi:hypothetical protein